jgi:hypothetical protein
MRIVSRVPKVGYCHRSLSGKDSLPSDKKNNFGPRGSARETRIVGDTRGYRKLSQATWLVC